MTDAVLAVDRLTRFRRWWSAATWGSARWQRILSAAMTALVVWPQSFVDPESGVDSSWQAAVALARMRHLVWGSEVLFTYGPLGFLQNTTYYAFDQAVLAAGYQVLVVAALFLGVLAALRQRYAPMTSTLGAIVVTGLVTTIHAGHGGSPLRMMMFPELAVLAAFAWAAVPLLERDPKPSTLMAVCTALAAFAGFQLLLKFNTGIPILASALALSLLADWKEVCRHCITVATCALSIPIWWALSGQPVRSLPAWLAYSVDLVSGYTDAQSIPLPSESATAVAWSLVWIGLVCAVLSWKRSGVPRRFAVLVLLATVLTGKAAFGRYELWHFSVLLGLVIVAVAITPRVGLRAFAVVLAVVLLVYYRLGAAAVHDRISMAAWAPVRAGDRVASFLLSDRVERHIQRAKAVQRATYAVPQRFIDTIGSAPVHIDPVEVSAAWAYDLAWRPAAVFQAYQANTPMLDKLNSETLTSGPKFVLSLKDSVPNTVDRADIRLWSQESPRYARSLLCNYSVAGVEGRWALFARTAPRCGALMPLADVDVDPNRPIPVPRPTEPGLAVLAGIDLYPTVLDRLFQGMLLPLTAFTVVLDRVEYRLITANANEPFLIETPVSVNGTNLEMHTHTIDVSRSRALGQDHVRARLHFYEMRVD